MKLLRSRVVVGFAASLVTALAVGTVALASASTSSPSTTITGCVARRGGEGGRGALRIIDPAHQQCRHDETLITWNQRGPQGNQGPQGSQGIAGIPGSAGAPGAPGNNGVNGASANVAVTNEPPGVNCPNGGKKLTTSVGAGPLTVSYVCNGTNGATGATGPQGSTGATGAQGPPGIPGSAGAPGAPGNNGVNGASANVAVTNEPPGVNCPNGGKKLTTSVGAGPVTVSYVCNGTNGATGPQGSTGATGAQGPPGVSSVQQAAFPFTRLTTPDTSTTVATVTLSAGKYLVSVMGDGLAFTNAQASLTCSLTGSSYVPNGITLSGNATGISATGIVTLASSGTVTFACSYSAAAGVGVILRGALTALQTG